MAKGRRVSDYQPSYDDAVERAERKGSMFDSLLKDVKFYRPKQGANLLRILPPGWKGADHYGLRVAVHRNVGPKDRQYLCLLENKSSPHKNCPICDALFDLGSRATQDDKKELSTSEVIVYYVVDRDNEKDGVQAWVVSPTADSEIAAQSINRRSKSVLNIVDPEEGYDIEFIRSGTTRNNTRYRGYQVMRESSPLSDNERRMDEWLDVAFEKPLTDMLQFYSPEHIEQVFHGRARDDDDEDRGSRRNRRDDDDKDDRSERRLERRRDDGDDDKDKDRASDRDERTSRGRDRDKDSDRDSDKDERSSRRDRSGDDDDNDRRGRDRDRSSRDDPDEDKGRARRGRDEDAEPERRGGRTRLQEDLDDEIPFDKRTRANGEDRKAEVVEKPERRARERLGDDDDADKDRPRGGRDRERGRDDDDDKDDRRSRTRGRDDDDDRGARSTRGRGRDDDDSDRNARARDRMREQLNRDRD